MKVKITEVWMLQLIHVFLNMKYVGVKFFYGIEDKISIKLWDTHNSKNLTRPNPDFKMILKLLWNKALMILNYLDWFN